MFIEFECSLKKVRRQRHFQIFLTQPQTSKGRTVYPDGTQVAFNSRKDFAERKLEVGDSRDTATHLVAPGITSDCVMEVSWSEMATGQFGGIPRRFNDGYYGRWVLSNSSPTKILTLEVARTFPLAWSITQGSAQKPEIKETGKYISYTFKDLPLLEVPPYGLTPLLRPPAFIAYYQPKILGATAQNHAPDVYWQEAISYYKRSYEEGVSLGSQFRDFAEDILKGLPEAPEGRASELLKRLDQRISNLGSSSFAEAASLPKDFWEKFETKNLGEAAKSKKTNGEGMRLLFFHLLKQAGLPPKVGKVVDRDKAFFRACRLTTSCSGQSPPLHRSPRCR